MNVTPIDHHNQGDIEWKVFNVEWGIGEMILHRRQSLVFEATGSDICSSCPEKVS